MIYVSREDIAENVKRRKRTSDTAYSCENKIEFIIVKYNLFLSRIKCQSNVFNLWEDVMKIRNNKKDSDIDYLIVT